MLEVYGRSDSVNVMKVLWTCAEVGARPVHHATRAGQAAREVDHLNPNGRVPVINDDGFVLWESNAIVRYVAYKYGLGSVYPMDVRERAQAEQWMEWQQTSLAPPLAYPWHALVRQGGTSVDAATLDRSLRELERLMAVLDAHLEDREWVVGKAFTMGDIPVGIAAWRWSRLPVERPAFPHVEAWLQTLSARDTFQTHVIAQA